MRRQTGKGKGSNLKPWGIRITPIGFPADPVGYISISVALVVVGWVNGCMDGYMSLWTREDSSLPSPTPKAGAKIVLPKAMVRKGKGLSWHVQGCALTHCLLIPSFSRGPRQT